MTFAPSPLRLPGRPECPSCGSVLDGFAAANGDEFAVPAEGDPTVCAYCATVLVFTPAGTWRLATGAEVDDLAGDPAFVDALGLVYERLGIQ